MTMAYGTEQAYASNQVYFRTFTDASITNSTDTTATIAVTSGIQYKDSRGLIGSCSKVVYQALYKTVGSTQTTLSERSNTNIYVESQAASSWTTIGEYSKTSTVSVTKTHSAQSLKFSSEMMITTAAYGNVPSEQAMGTGYVTINVPAKTSYTVAYNANGGSDAPSSETKWYGEALAVSSAVPTRAGYRFKNWNTASDGSGTSYSSGASYTVNAQATLYAQWEPTLEITSASIVRCDSAGNQDAMGGYVKAVVAWNTDSSISGTSLALSCLSPSASATESISGSSGTTTVGPIGGSFRADTTYSFTVSLTDSLSNTISETVVSTASSTGYTMPVISTVSAIRSDSLGSPDDGGEYCFTTFSWSIAAIGSQTAPSSCVVKAYEYGTQTAIVTQSVTLTGTSGTNSVLVGGNVFSPDKQYMVEVVLADALNTVTKSDVMSTGYFTMDVLAGGRGIAMGKPATVVDVLDVGYDIHSDGEVTATDANLVSHNLTEKVDRAGDTMTGGLTVDAGSVYLKSTNLDRDGAAPSSQTIGNAALNFHDKDGEKIGLLQTYANTNGAQVVGLYAFNEDANGDQVQTQLNLYANKDGTHSYYINDPEAFRSAINTVDKSGDTISGTLTADGTYFCAKSTNIDRDGTAPSSTTRSDSRFFMRDKDGEFIGQMRISQDSAGMIMLELMVGNENTSNSEVTNTISIRVAKDGTQTYAVSNQAAFRSAIGLGTDKAWTTLASGTDFYIKYAKYRNVVFVTADSKGGKTASSSDYTTLGTLPSGYRPATEHLFASGTRGSSNTFTVRVTTAGVVGLNCSGSGGNYWAFTICFPVT